MLAQLFDRLAIHRTHDEATSRRPADIFIRRALAALVSADSWFQRIAGFLMSYVSSCKIRSERACTDLLAYRAIDVKNRVTAPGTLAAPASKTVLCIVRAF